MIDIHLWMRHQQLNGNLDTLAMAPGWVAVEETNTIRMIPSPTPPLLTSAVVSTLIPLPCTIRRTGSADFARSRSREDTEGDSELSITWPYHLPSNVPLSSLEIPLSPASK
jgi:hypothetical protein